MEEKIDFIFALRAKGEKSKTAIQAGYKKQFGSAKDFQSAWNSVEEILKEYFQRNIELLAPEMALHYWDLYAKSYKLQDYRECRAILKDIRDLTGIVHEAAPPNQEKKPKSVLTSFRPKKTASA